MLNISDDIHHVSLGDREIKDWRIQTSFVVLYSRYDSEKDLRADWAEFEELPLGYQKQSDYKSIDIYGLTNKDRYDSMLSVFLKNDIDDELYDKQYSPMHESQILNSVKNITPNRSYAYKNYAESLDNISSALTCLKMDECTFVSESATKIATKKLEAKIKLDNDMDIDVSTFFSPQELEQIGLSYIDGSDARYSDTPDNTLIGTISVKQWFNEYKNKFIGFGSESVDPSEWKVSMQKLYSDYDKIKESKNIDKINARKQSILDLGWNPEIAFTESNMRNASSRISTILNEMYSNYSIADISDTISLKEDFLNGAVREVVSKPIFIVFFNSKTAFNKIVRVFTNSVYSHVGISFEPSLKTIYSFSGTTGGFSPESLKNRIEVGQDRAIQVFCIFIDPVRWHTLQNKIANYRKNKEKSGYSFLNLLTIPFKIDYISNTKMVCSQFVDSMLKLVDLDFTHMASNMISPGELNKKMKMKKYKGTIYKIFTGPPSKYSASKVRNALNMLGGSVTKIKEGFEKIESFINLIPIKETKDFPIQFNDDGDLLISKGTDVDFEGEYSRCHMAIQQYAKAKNVEGMKYCLCKLWYLNILLEENIHKAKDKDKLKNYHKARSKIINDITTYMKAIQKLDKNFDMLKEYQDSPFNDDAVRIRRSTLLYSIDLFKRLITGVI